MSSVTIRPSFVALRAALAAVWYEQWDTRPAGGARARRPERRAGTVECQQTMPRHRLLIASRPFRVAKSSRRSRSSTETGLIRSIETLLNIVLQSCSSRGESGVNVRDMSLGWQRSISEGRDARVYELAESAEGEHGQPRTASPSSSPHISHGR